MPRAYATRVGGARGLALMRALAHNLHVAKGRAEQLARDQKDRQVTLPSFPSIQPEPVREHPRPVAAIEASPQPRLRVTPADLAAARAAVPAPEFF